MSRWSARSTRPATRFRITHGASTSAQTAQHQAEEREGPRGSVSSTTRQSAADEQRQRREPDVAQDRQAEDDTEPSGELRGAPLQQSEREHEDARCEQAVEDLAVDVDVVPERVRMQARRAGPRTVRPTPAASAGRSRTRSATSRSPRRSALRRPPPTNVRATSRAGSGRSCTAAGCTRVGCPGMKPNVPLARYVRAMSSLFSPNVNGTRIAPRCSDQRPRGAAARPPRR